MGKDSKGSHSRFRKEHNNYNPYNKLELNKFHQTQQQGHHKYSHQLHKRKRDLERMIQHFRTKGMQVDQAKLDELDQIEGQLGGRKKEYQKEKRKEFFLSNKYKQIMNIERRKVARKLKQLKEAQPSNKTEWGEWIKKLNYIRHFPKNLKYISLFPTSPLSEKALAFQTKIMQDIEDDLTKKQQKLNKFQPEYQKAHQMKPSKKDDFFLEEEEGEAGERGKEQGEEEQGEEEEEQEQGEEEEEDDVDKEGDEQDGEEWGE